MSRNTHDFGVKTRERKKRDVNPLAPNLTMCKNSGSDINDTKYDICNILLIMSANCQQNKDKIIWECKNFSNLNLNDMQRDTESEEN